MPTARKRKTLLARKSRKCKKIPAHLAAARRKPRTGKPFTVAVPGEDRPINGRFSNTEGLTFKRPYVDGVFRLTLVEAFNIARNKEELPLLLGKQFEKTAHGGAKVVEP